MARPLRLEYIGALYHVTSRGDRRDNIYIDDGDREQMLLLLGEVSERFNWVVHSYCLGEQPLPSVDRDPGRQSIEGDAPTEWCLYATL